MKSAIIAVLVVLGVLVTLIPSRGAATADAQLKIVKAPVKLPTPPIRRKFKLNNKSV